MKKKSIILLMVAFLIFLAIPFKTNATTPVTIYFFRGDGCSYCAAAESFLESLAEDEEYKDLFVVKEFETWYDEDNADFAEEVADVMGDDLGGVPYIIIGDETWNGYSSNYDEDLKAKIKEVAEDENFVDPLAEMVANYEAGNSEENNSSLVSIAILLGVVIVIGGGLYFARRGVESDSEKESKTKKKKEIPSEKKDEKVVEEPEEKAEEVAEKKTEEKKEEQVVEKTSKPKTTKKNASKNTNTKKKTTTAKKTNNNKKRTTKNTAK